MAIRYVRPGASGNGTSWALAWGSLSSITGLSGGDICYIGAGTYSGGEWQPPMSGVAGNPVIYRAAQDTYTGLATITLSTGITGSLSGNVTNGFYLDGNYNGSRNITLEATLGRGYNFLNTRMSYLNWTGIVQADSLYGWEMDHCVCTPPKNCDHMMAKGAGSSGTASYTTNLIHHNLIYLYGSTTPGFGDDGFQWIANCSIYNNTFIGVPSAGTYTNHQDYIQTNGSYLAFYNNYCEGTAQYFILREDGGAASHWRIYNNITRGRSTTDQHYAIGSQGGDTDFIIANNTLINNGGAGGGIRLGTGYPGSGSGNYIVNNICYDVDILVGAGTSCTVANNAQGTSNLAFVNDANYPNNNHRLTAAATAAINQGISPSYLTNVYTTDADGNTRTGTWDIGAYEYGSSGATPPVGTPILSVR